VRRMFPNRSRVRNMVLAIYALMLISNWTIGPRLYPNYQIIITSTLVTIMVADLLIFGTMESIRRRARNRKRNDVVS
jgi:hypothetical protein